MNLLGQRLSSITTRIKTTLSKSRRIKVEVRDYLPLQQGLRRPEDSIEESTFHVRDYLPLQQGLRHITFTIDETGRVTSETIFHYNKD